MLNKEIYKHKLEDVLVKVLAVSKNGEICRCEDIAPCEKCIFYGGDCGDCVENTKKWLNAECKGTAMLNDEEKAYLSAVIKPFRKKVKHIVKINLCSSPEEQFIRIVIGNLDFINFPNFNKNTGMYKGMEADKLYSLEELGL